MPGGALEAETIDPSSPQRDESTDDVLESTLRRELFEELGIQVGVVHLLRIDTIPYIAEEPGQYHLVFYYRCVPDEGIYAFRERIYSGEIQPRSSEVDELRFVPFDCLNDYDLVSHQATFLARVAEIIPIDPL